jgi:polyhydroxyalkanoate synthesis regulator phasin
MSKQASQTDSDSQPTENAQARGQAADEIERQARNAAGGTSAEISERVRGITLQALADGRLSRDAIRSVMDAVVKGAQQGAASRGSEEAHALRQSMKGLDEALASAAEATQLALQEAGKRGEAFSHEVVRQTRDELSALESLFIETLGNAARSASGIARATLQDLNEHARSSGTAVGGRIHSALSELTQGLADTARGQVEDGARIVRNEAAILAGMAAGLLRGIADRLHPPESESGKPNPPDQPR